MKKLTFEFVKQKFLEGGCILLEESYTNNSTLVRYRCKCGNESKTRYKDFIKGMRCAKCSGKEKHTFDFVKAKFEAENCLLLDNIYKNCQTRMQYICSCGNESKITYKNFNKGKRCAKCGNSEKHTFVFVKQKFLDSGCILLEENYINNNKPMKYKCICGNESKITYMNFRQGQRCSKCKNKTERIVSEFLEEKYTNIVFQAKFEWCKNKKCLPFDFLIDNMKILIEVDGLQHFKQVSNWQSPEETLRRDTIKAKEALIRGYSVIRISQEDIFRNTIDWKQILIEKLKPFEVPDCIYISKDPYLYNGHKNAMNLVII